MRSRAALSQALRTALSEAASEGCSKEIIDRGTAKLKDADKVQAKKREQERLVALGKRRDECNTMLEGVLSARKDPLDTDIKKVKAAIAEIDALASMDGPGEVKESLVAETRAWLETVEAAWAERRAEREAALASASIVLPLVDADTLRKACTEAEAAGAAVL